MNILVVEDEPKVAQAVHPGLQSEGAQVASATTGEEGYFLATTHAFELIVLDLMLPGRDGLEILQALTPAGGHIKVRPEKMNRERLAVDSIDDGPGIPLSDRTRVFERFHRLDKGRSRDEGGCGLGLAIARWAVEINAGTIQCHHTEGPGAWYGIILPAYTPAVILSETKDFQGVKP